MRSRTVGVAVPHHDVRVPDVQPVIGSRARRVREPHCRVRADAEARPVGRPGVFQGRREPSHREVVDLGQRRVVHDEPVNHLDIAEGIRGSPEVLVGCQPGFRRRNLPAHIPMLPRVRAGTGAASAGFGEVADPPGRRRKACRPPCPLGGSPARAATGLHAWPTCAASRQKHAGAGAINQQESSRRCELCHAPSSASPRPKRAVPPLWAQPLRLMAVVAEAQGWR
jgi:hypothetical protein